MFGRNVSTQPPKSCAERSPCTFPMISNRPGDPVPAVTITQLPKLCCSSLLPTSLLQKHEPLSFRILQEHWTPSGQCYTSKNNSGKARGTNLLFRLEVKGYDQLQIIKIQVELNRFGSAGFPFGAYSTAQLKGKG